VRAPPHPTTALPLAGKQRFYKATRVSCRNCLKLRDQGTCDLIYGGLWPLTGGRPATFIDKRLLRFTASMETIMPQMPLGGLLQGVNRESARYGGSASLLVSAVAAVWGRARYLWTNHGCTASGFVLPMVCRRAACGYITRAAAVCFGCPHPRLSPTAHSGTSREDD
jgi:hypothetical protein